MKISKGFFILLIITSCNNKNEIPITHINNSSIRKYKELALTKGDTISYNELSIAYLDSPNDGFLYTALIMANKYNYPQAYSDVYSCLTDRNHKKEFTELDSLDEKTRALALDYLTAGAENGSKECKRLLGHFYIEGKYLKKDTLKGNSLLKESE